MRSVAMLLLVACSGGETPPRVTITTVTQPRMMMARDDATGVWVALAGDTAFTYDPAGPYRITAACDEGNGLTTLWQFARTPDDDRALDIPCGTLPRTAQIATTMVQPGHVAVEDAIAVSSDPQWPVGLETSPGEHVLIATSATHVQIQRGLAIDGFVTLPVIDVEAQGIPYVPSPITVTNLADGELVQADVTLAIGASRGRVYSGPLSAAVAIPMEALEAGDEQVQRATATLGRTRRFASRVGSGAASFELPDPLVDATFSVTGHDATATWSSDNPGEVSLEVFATLDGTLIFHSLQVTETYAALLDRAVTLELADLPLPASAAFDYATTEHDRTLAITRRGDSASTGVSVVEQVNRPAGAQSHRRPHSFQ